MPDEDESIAKSTQFDVGRHESHASLDFLQLTEVPESYKPFLGALMDLIQSSYPNLTAEDLESEDVTVFIVAFFDAYDLQVDKRTLINIRSYIFSHLPQNHDLLQQAFLEDVINELVNNNDVYREQVIDILRNICAFLEHESLEQLEKVGKLPQIQFPKHYPLPTIQTDAKDPADAREKITNQMIELVTADYSFSHALNDFVSSLQEIELPLHDIIAYIREVVEE